MMDTTALILIKAIEHIEALSYRFNQQRQRHTPHFGWFNHEPFGSFIGTSFNILQSFAHSRDSCGRHDWSWLNVIGDRLLAWICIESNESSDFTGLFSFHFPWCRISHHQVEGDSPTTHFPKTRKRISLGQRHHTSRYHLGNSGLNWLFLPFRNFRKLPYQHQPLSFYNVS